MLPPKEEEGSGDHHFYSSEDILDTKSLHSFDLNFNQEDFNQDLNSKAVEVDEEKIEGKLSSTNPFNFESSEEGSSSTSPRRQSFEEYHEENATGNTLILIGSKLGEQDSPLMGLTTDEISSSGLLGSNTIEVIEVLQNLESLKTPDPAEMETSIVRANFVDFSTDDEINEITPSAPPTDDLIEIEDSKEFSLSLNPDLPKIRAQQIQNWLQFEKESEKDDSLEEDRDEHAEQESNGGINETQNYDLDSLSEANGATTVTDADGVQRRVRFLTDPHGNILISVYLTKLVQLILSIIKLVSAGYLDFTSTPGTPLSTTKSLLAQDSSESISSSANSSISDTDTDDTKPLDSDLDSDLFDLTLSSFNFLCHYNETDDYVIPNEKPDVINSGDGEEELEVVHQANGDGTFGAALLESELVNIDLNPKVDQPTQETDEKKKKANNQDELGKEEISSGNGTEESNSTEKYSQDKDLLKEEEEVKEKFPLIDEVRKVISVDPSLSLTNNFDESEDIGSDSETMSTSSCSSMIEVIPKKSEEDIIAFDKEEDNGIDENNNNELKACAFNLEDSQVREKSTTFFKFEPEKEIKSVIEVKGAPSEIVEPAAAIVDVILKNEDQIVETKTHMTSVEIKDNDSFFEEPTTTTTQQSTQEEEEEVKNFVPEEILRFNPFIEPEMHDQEILKVETIETIKAVAPVPPAKPQNKGGAQIIDFNNNNQDYPINNNEQDVFQLDEKSFENPHGFREDSEGQLESLCIQEEPISAVALTIAKWESFSKKQQKPKESVERTNSVLKGKLILPSYTNNSNGNGNNTINIASIAQHQIHGKPVQVLPTGCNLNGILQSKVLASNNHNNSPNGNDQAKEINSNECNNGTSSSKISAAGWNTFNNNNNVKSNETSLQEDEEAIYAQPNSNTGLTTSLSNPSKILKAYPKPNSRGEIINWFKEGEIHRSGILLSYGQTSHHTTSVTIPQNVSSPVIVSWFFGLITRQQAEEFLHGQPNGTFLVRISTRIWGYTLSYQSNNKTKHFLISGINPAVPGTLSAGNEARKQNSPTPTGKQQLLFPFSPGGRYAFIGTNMTPYTTLSSLIRHHSHAPITKVGGEKLINPCPSGPRISGIEYVFK